MMLFYLLVGHALADFPLQGQFLAEAKNPTKPIGEKWWPMALPMHGLIHGGAVAIITGSLTLGIIEWFLHTIIDYFTCIGKIDLYVDQYLHIMLKFLYWIVIV